MSYKFYTKEDEATIKEMRAQGATEREIASALGRTVSAIHLKIRTMRKRGEIASKYVRELLTPEDLVMLADTYSVPLWVVKRIDSQLSGKTKQKLHTIEELVKCYLEQDGKCYYLGTPFMEGSVYGQIYVGKIGSEYCLLSGLVKDMRRSMSHDTFVRACRVVASQFG